MTQPPAAGGWRWARATGERLARAFITAFCSYLFEEWVGSLVALTPIGRAAVFAAGLTLSTVALAWVARRFGQPGTDSFLNFIGYDGTTR